MQNILLGHDRKSGQPVYMPVKALKTHLHLIGGTGKGKTTALHTMLQPLMLDPFDEGVLLHFRSAGQLLARIAHVDGVGVLHGRCS